uniref:Galaxin-like repeats domain-containing protein n=1 Tax=Strigamia maritima TaxID=126957 RepID=T1JDU8_STRMM
MAFQTTNVILFFIQVILCETIDQSKYRITIERPSGKPYAPAIQMCCNGVTQPKSNQHTACCGNQTYNEEIEICCNDSVTSKTSDLRCCFNQLYDTKTHKCSLYVHQANINLMNNGIVLTTRDTLIVLPITKENEFPCGTGVVDLKTSTCCGEKPIPLSGIMFPQCCGDKLMDPKVDFCCFNHFGTDFLILIPKVNYTADCCNGKPFDVNRQVCTSTSNGTIIDLPDINTKWCNNQLFDTRDKICCSNKNIVTKLKSHHSECCGNVTFAPKEKLCCDDNLIAKSSGIKCCPGSGSYDPTKDTCCSPDISVTSEKKTRLFKDELGLCCYLTAYDETKESCCGISVIPKSPDGLSGCCEYNLNVTKATLDEIFAYKKPSNTLHSDLFKRLKDIQKSILPESSSPSSSTDTLDYTSPNSQQLLSLSPWVFLLYLINFI